MWAVTVWQKKVHTLGRCCPVLKCGGWCGPRNCDEGGQLDRLGRIGRR
jgi:hypothetical protein